MCQGLATDFLVASFEINIVLSLQHVLNVIAMRRIPSPDSHIQWQNKPWFTLALSTASTNTHTAADSSTYSNKSSEIAWRGRREERHSKAMPTKKETRPATNNLIISETMDWMGAGRSGRALNKGAGLWSTWQELQESRGGSEGREYSLITKSNLVSRDSNFLNEILLRWWRKREDTHTSRLNMEGKATHCCSAF